MKRFFAALVMVSAFGLGACADATTNSDWTPMKAERTQQAWESRTAGDEKMETKELTSPKKADKAYTKSLRK